jgi:NADH-quinone oxidoreductase subunit L
MEWILAGVAVATALIGLGIAYWLYFKRPEKADGFAKSMAPVYRTLLNKYYVDELYDAAIVKPLLWISTNVLWKTADVSAIDGAVNGIAHGAMGVGDRVRRTQSGNTRSYAVWVVIGALVVVAAIFFWPSGRPLFGLVR